MGMDKRDNRRTKPFDNRIEGSALFTSAGSENEAKEGLNIKLMEPESSPIRLTTIPASHRFLCFHVICAARVRTSPKLKFIPTPLRFSFSLRLFDVMITR